MTTSTWQSVVTYTSLAISFILGGLNVVGSSVPHSTLIIFVLTGIAGILHGPAVVAGANKALIAQASNRS